jgi:O-antigen biosynthesis protein
MMRPSINRVSIVISTYDRPLSLEETLQCLLRQKTSVELEIIVVDNHPQSGITSPIIEKFPTVRFFREPRAGTSYGWNMGALQATGQVIVMTADDVVPPDDWIEKIVQVMRSRDCDLLSGDILPYYQDDLSKIFEEHAGLGRGKTLKIYDRKWFDSFRTKSVPAHLIGAGANFSARVEVFADPNVGLLEDSMGPGTPASASEDAYLCYRILKAGYTIVYDPDVWIYHKHRRSIDELKKVIFNYTKGMVAYELMTLTKEGDLRAILQLGVRLPLWRFFELFRTFWSYISTGNPERFDMFRLKLRGDLAGPGSFIRAQKRVKELGRSAKFVLPHQRHQITPVHDQEMGVSAEGGIED